MAHDAHATADHGHGDHGGHGGHGGADHVPHVLPVITYLKTWGTLMVLTVVTVAASYVNLGPLNLPIALLIATMKAAVVALVFMHLYYDSKFNLVIFASSVIFLGIFIAFTMSDTETRGLADEIEKYHPADIKQPFDFVNIRPITREDKIRKAEADAFAKSQAPAVAPPTNQPSPGQPSPDPKPSRDPRGPAQPQNVPPP